MSMCLFGHDKEKSPEEDEEEEEAEEENAFSRRYHHHHNYDHNYRVLFDYDHSSDNYKVHRFFNLAKKKLEKKTACFQKKQQQQKLK